MNLSFHRLQLEPEGPAKSAREETKGLGLLHGPHPWVLFGFESLIGAFTPRKGGRRGFLAHQKGWRGLEFPDKDDFCAMEAKGISGTGFNRSKLTPKGVQGSKHTVVFPPHASPAVRKSTKTHPFYQECLPVLCSRLKCLKCKTGITTKPVKC